LEIAVNISEAMDAQRRISASQYLHCTCQAAQAQSAANQLRLCFSVSTAIFEHWSDFVTAILIKRARVPRL